MTNLLIKWVPILMGLWIGYNLFMKYDGGEFDDLGNASTVLFVVDGCPPCKQAAAHLKRLGVDFELVKPERDAEAKKRYGQYKTNEYPLLVVGDVKATGYSKHLYLETFAKGYGLSSLSSGWRNVYQTHFDGLQPRVVMYGASWCGYCAKARKQFANAGIDYVEWDVEKNTAAAKRFKQLGGNGYPLIYVGFERMTSVNKSKVVKALGAWAEPI